MGKTINGTDVTTYIVDKDRSYAQVLEEHWSNGALSATTGYVYGDALISRTVTHPNPSQEGTFYYHYDGMGSVRGLTDATGAITDTYQYDAYGILLNNTGSTINPYRYRGGQLDADLSAYYLRARYYQPGIGRFLTTDPEEGMVGDPLSAHRYIYGHNNPVNNIDPSGKSKLEDMMITVGMISTLASFSVQVFTMANEDFGDFFANLLPDAGLIGISGSASLKAIKTLKLLFGTVPLDPGFIAVEAAKGWRGLDASVGGVLGGEVLFSISSAQYGFYGYGGWLAERGNYMGKQWMLNGGFAIYHGWIWNLWNTDDYVGPFHSVNFGFGPHGGFSLFKDARRSFDKGPFGVSFSALAWSPRQGYTFSAGFSKTWYPRWAYDYHNEKAGMYEVAIKFMACEMVLFNLSVLTMETGIGSPLGAMTSLASVAWPTTIAMTKEIWNRRRTNPGKPKENYSIDARQFPGSKRPEGFSSGPKRWIFWGE